MGRPILIVLGGSARTLGNMKRTVMRVMAERAAVKVTQAGDDPGWYAGDEFATGGRRAAAVDGGDRELAWAGGNGLGLGGALARFGRCLGGGFGGDFPGFLGGGLTSGLGQVAGIAHFFERRKDTVRQSCGGGRGLAAAGLAAPAAAAAGAAAAARRGEFFRERHGPAQRLCRGRGAFGASAGGVSSTARPRRGALFGGGGRAWVRRPGRARRLRGPRRASLSA